MAHKQIKHFTSKSVEQSDQQLDDSKSTKQVDQTKKDNEHHFAHKFRHTVHRIKQVVNMVFDVVMFFALILVACALNSTSHNNNNVVKRTSFTQPKTKAKAKKKVKIPKAEVKMGDAYELVPKKKVTRYRYKTNAYGYRYKVKLKHPKVKYLANFYIDPNYASKSNLITQPIYVLINGSIISKPKTLTPSQTPFNESNYVFDDKHHYTLYDTVPYLHVMQFVSYRRYGKRSEPNTQFKRITQVSVMGANRYLKLSEFTLIRKAKLNLSTLAENKQLFAGYSK